MKNPSYVHGASADQLLPLTVGDCFDRTARMFPTHDALIVPHQGVCWTYQRLSEEVDRYAAGLIAHGLERGARIGIWAPNCWEWVVTQFATAKAGLILVNINPAYRVSELEYALSKVECSALITAPALKSSNYIEMLDELLPELASAAPGRLRCERFPDLRLVIRLGQETSPGFLNFADICLLYTSDAADE